MATQIVELSGDEAALLRSYDRAVKKQAELEAKLRAGGEAGAAAGTQVEDALRKVQDASDQALRGLLRDLQAAGPQGQVAATAIKGHFVEAGKAGFKSVDSIIDQIRAIDPAAADAAAAIEREMAAAANSSENQIHGVLNELRALGPEGRRAADKMEEGFKAAGKISAKSVEDVAKAFSKIDPEVAKIAQGMVANLNTETEAAKTPFTNLAAHGVEQIKTISAALIGVDGVTSAIQAVIQGFEEQRKKMDEVAAAQVKIGEKQQEVFKQSVGTTLVQQSDLLQKAAPAIAMSEGIPLGDVLDSLVAVKSAGGTDEQAVRHTSAGAKLNVGTPANTKDFAKGSMKMEQITGMTPEESMSFMIRASGPSPIEDPAQLNRQLARGIQAAKAFNPGVDSKELARQQGALINTLGQLTGDETGDSTITANTSLNAQLREVFQGVPNAPADAGGKVEYLQQNAELRAKFLGNLRGEEIFKPQFEQLVDPNSDAWKTYKENYTANAPGDRTEYDTKVAQVRGATPQLSAMQLQARTDVAVATAQDAQHEVGMLSNARATVQKGLELVRPQGFFGVMQKFGDFTQRGALEGQTALQETISGIEELSKRRELIKKDGIQAGEVEKINAIDAMIGQLRETATANIRNRSNINTSGFDSFASQVENEQRSAFRQGGESERAVSSDVLQALNDIRTVMKEVAVAAQATAATNAAMVAPAQATATNTQPKTPPVAGAIGSATAGP